MHTSGIKQTNHFESDTEEVETGDGDKTYRAIFSKGDELQWFDT